MTVVKNSLQRENNNTGIDKFNRVTRAGVTRTGQLEQDHSIMFT